MTEERLQNISLAEQRAYRQQNISRGHGPVDGYSPEQFGKLNDDEKLKFVRQIDGEYRRFAEDYPQIMGLFERDTADQSLEASVNLRRLNEWLQAHHVAPSYLNLVSAFQSIFDQLFLEPSKAGIQGFPGLGRDVVRDMPAADFKKLLQPVVQNQKPEERMTADEYRRAHPEGWADERAEIQAEDVRYVQQQVRNFLANRLAYVPSAENLDSMCEGIKRRGLRFNLNSFLEVYDDLVAAGKMQVNQNADLKVGSTRRVDYGASDGVDKGLINLL